MSTTKGNRARRREHEARWRELVVQVEAAGYSVEQRAWHDGMLYGLGSLAAGITRKDTRSVLILEDLTFAQKVEALEHELVHVREQTTGERIFRHSHDPLNPGFRVDPDEMTLTDRVPRLKKVARR